tara:strand:- start:843 stop:1157 length:315 start_codon:yes stop_codon:yes gene_type:complete
MQRFIPSAKLYVGQLVVVSTHAEAQVRTIAQIHKRKTGTVYAVTFLWKEGDRVCGEFYQPWGLYKPTLDQIEYSITANGALINKNDVCKYVIKQIESARTTEEA